MRTHDSPNSHRHAGILTLAKADTSTSVCDHRQADIGDGLLVGHDRLVEEQIERGHRVHRIVPVSVAARGHVASDTDRATGVRWWPASATAEPAQYRLERLRRAAAAV